MVVERESGMMTADWLRPNGMHKTDSWVAKTGAGRDLFVCARKTLHCRHCGELRCSLVFLGISALS